MSYIIVDVEADGPIPYKYSMVSFGAIILDNSLDKTFLGETKPISDLWIPDALKVSGISRDQHLKFNDPKEVMEDFTKWIKKNSTGNHIFISDNPAFDWQWINYYFYTFLDHNPFGHSARRIGDLYSGMLMDTRKGNEWKRKFRKTKHDHNPVNDAKSNAEALLAMCKLGLKIPNL
jgi:DNA polymerase III epsilon subunit-like protein